MMRIFFKGFNFSQDGPGNRLVYHLSGCNMHCPWCSNPEGMTLCAGEETAPQVILEECFRSRPMFFGGGGVTFTGGEATLQEEELLQVLHRLQQEGIHTALETNATSAHLPIIANHVDYLMMDFKHYDSDVLQRRTGIGNETVKANFEELCRIGRQLHVRIPLINGFNTDFPQAFASYFADHHTAKTVFEFLPYHELGKGKWQNPYTIVDGFVSPQTIEEFRRVFASYHLCVVTT